MREDSRTVCGVDVAKAHLDAWAKGASVRVANDSQGALTLAAWCRERDVGSVGIEATGRYGRVAAGILRAEGLRVHLVQPAFVKAFRTSLGRRAKTDHLDAEVIALYLAFRAQNDPLPDETPTPVDAVLDQHLTRLRQIEEDIVRAKTRREGFDEESLRAALTDEITALKAKRRAAVADLVARVQACPERARRLALIASVQGIGERTALTLLIALPELGRLSREKIAALAGLAPFDDQSGERHGRRHIAGGRADVRTSLYAAALPAVFHHNPKLGEFYRRLVSAGKHHRCALVAAARKLLVYANAVVERGTPWVKSPAPT